MPAKKSYYAELASKANQALVYARIDRLVNSSSTHVKAYASVNLGGAFSVHGLKVVDSINGLFVQMPQTSYKKQDGKVAYTDVFHPTTADARAEIKARVLEAYHQKIAEDPSQAAAPPEPQYAVIEDADPNDPFGSQLPFDMSM